MIDWQLTPRPIPHSAKNTSSTFDRNPLSSKASQLFRAMQRHPPHLCRHTLTAVNIALLTIYDMCKAVNRRMTVINIRSIQ
ncbi:cyclic pyranopterin monophosphate synthase MoaC [Polaromonas sp. OV174]|uniref:cyclic pyranopterin monophosphate synthase MoaC n=1 Tax=Polaromonas sp. OV174 TaxID=1855300 RepID=UPI000B859346